MYIRSNQNIKKLYEKTILSFVTTAFGIFFIL